MKNVRLKPLLDNLYKMYNRKELISPDPLQFVTPYSRVEDREIIGLIASALAYGRVTQILKSVRAIIDVMNPSPSDFIKQVSKKELLKLFIGFKHRFTTGEEMSRMIYGMQQAIKKHGSLQNCFLMGLKQENDTILPALINFVEEINLGESAYLLPAPKKGSACKRLNLFLRWMVRNDSVDPGGWNKVPKAKLIIPLDTHMYSIGRILGFTLRKQANLKTALEITGGFSKLIPEDPTRYDFVLTRFGIRDDMKMEDFIKQLKGQTGVI